MSGVINCVTQIGIVTRDAVAMARRYAEVYGVGDWVIIDGSKGFDPSQKAHNLKVWGKPQDFEITLAKAMIGDMEIELIQPLDEYSDYAIFLKEHGEGIHHISIEGDLNRITSIMDDRNVPEVLSGTIPGVETFRYFATTPELGFTIEIHDRENC